MKNEYPISRPCVLWKETRLLRLGSPQPPRMNLVIKGKTNRRCAPAAEEDAANVQVAVAVDK
jgi:hypothetical protein